MFITQLKLCETNISYWDMLIIIDSVMVSWILKISEAQNENYQFLQFLSSFNN